MKPFIFLFACLFTASACNQQPPTESNPVVTSVTLTKEQLKDKIMGGWAGQTIGVTFGGPYEFRFQGAFIGDFARGRCYH